MKKVTYYCDLCGKETQCVMSSSTRIGDNYLMRHGDLCPFCFTSLQAAVLQWRKSRKPLEVVDE